MREHGAQPWRFSVADYEAAIKTVSSLGQTLTGKVIDASWDTALSMAMQQREVPIAEEALAVCLLQDLDNR